MAENRSRTSNERRQTGHLALASGLAAAAIACVASGTVYAQAGGGSGAAGPTYQRKGTFAEHGPKHGGDWRQRPMMQYSSRTSAGSFQRPYPYHLDYYRAKWGGSYAPYFGNLYGPPNYFFNGTGFFGGFGPYSGFNGFNGGFGFNGGYSGFGNPWFGGGANWGGAPYGPWAGEFMDGAGPPIEVEAGP